jgi:hypothetical protein
VNQAAHEALIAEALAEGEFAPFPTAEELGVEDASDDELESTTTEAQT